MKLRAGIFAMLICGAVACQASDAVNLEPRYKVSLKNCERFAGSTSEQSCGGTWLEAFVCGEEIRLLRWDIETSRHYISRDFYFAKGHLELVVERVVQKWSDGELADGRDSKDWTQKEISFLRIRPGGSSYPVGFRDESWRALRRHADELMSEFRDSRASFERVAAK